MTTQEKFENIVKLSGNYINLRKYQVYQTFHSVITKLFLGLYITENEADRLKLINSALLDKKDSKNEQILLINLIYNLLETNKLL